MSETRDTSDPDTLSIEDEVNERRGYKSITHSTKVSTKSKHQAMDMLHGELGGDLPRHHLGQPSRDHDKGSEDGESER
ncbi:hypothetical protein N7535_001731 [Penicillium sp. DV-2018c]|nr:hypothetical protein N7461_005027 [Penicillium sp. DV-2018c]KAJ5583111.1 hypothetical protein N7535_001731 [Penicillium sp. DV-2018c]